MSLDWKILRDVVLVALGCFMLVHETLIAEEPRQLIVGAGFGLLGVPVLARLERRREE